MKTCYSGWLQTPPLLPHSGQDATDFEDHTNAAKSAATLAKADSFFNGLTPNLRSGPPAVENGPDYPPWLAEVGAEAEAKGTRQDPTLSDRQDCLDCCYTIERNAQASIDECT